MKHGAVIMGAPAACGLHPAAGGHRERWPVLRDGSRIGFFHLPLAFQTQYYFTSPPQPSRWELSDVFAQGHRPVSGPAWCAPRPALLPLTATCDPEEGRAQNSHFLLPLEPMARFPFATLEVLYKHCLAFNFLCLGRSIKGRRIILLKLCLPSG